MRIGCIGCLSLILLVLALAVGVAGALFLSANIFDAPDFQPTPFSAADGHAAQRKLFEIVLRDSGRSSRQEPVVLSDREANAFLSRHLVQARGLALDPLSVRFTRGEMELTGRTAVRSLLTAPPFPFFLPYFPDKRLDEPIWLTIRGRIAFEPGAGGAGGRARLELTQLMLGRQPVGTWILYALMGQSSLKLRRWQVPGVVQDLRIEEGRLVIRTR